MKNKDEYITKEDAFNIAINYISPSMFDDMKNLLKEDIEEYETEYSLSKGTLEQILWERDLAISQLHDLGLDLGIKNTTLIRKDQALNYLYDAVMKYDDDIESILTEFTIKIGQGKPFTKQEIEEMLLED